MCNCVKTGSVAASARPAGRPLFEYVGPTGLTVFGPASGRRYRFEQHGARLAVDPRDLSALRAVPQLRIRADA